MFCYHFFSLNFFFWFTVKQRLQIIVAFNTFRVADVIASFIKMKKFYIWHHYVSIQMFMFFYCSSFVVLTISHQMSLSYNTIDSVCLTYASLCKKNISIDGLSTLE